MYWIGQNEKKKKQHIFTVLHWLWFPPCPFTNFSHFTPETAPLISSFVAGGPLQYGAKSGESCGVSPS